MSLNTPTFLRPLLSRPVAVLGAGVCARGVAALLAKIGVADVQVYDPGQTPGIDFTAAAAARCGVVIFSPQISRDHPWLVAARAAGCECLGELDFAALFWRGQVVAVAGTEGPATLAAFLTHALRGHGFEAAAADSRRTPFSQLVADHGGGSLAAAEKIAVCEVGFAQAGALRHFRAEAALWTNFSDDRRPDPAADFAATWTLLACTAPRAFFAGSSVQVNASRFGRPLPANSVVATAAQPFDHRLAGTVFATYPERENFLLAAAWWRAAGLQADELYAAARSFRAAGAADAVSADGFKPVVGAGEAFEIPASLPN